MTTQEKIILATENSSKAYLTFIDSVELYREHSKISNQLMEGKLYTTKDMNVASSTALVNMILNNKI